MTTSFFTSASIFVFAGFSISTSFFTLTGLIVASLSANLLLLVVLNIIKPFYIKKLVINANNTTVTKILKDII